MLLHGRGKRVVWGFFQHNFQLFSKKKKNFSFKTIIYFRALVSKNVFKTLLQLPCWEKQNNLWRFERGIFERHISALLFLLLLSIRFSLVEKNVFRYFVYNSEISAKNEKNINSAYILFLLLKAIKICPMAWYYFECECALPLFISHKHTTIIHIHYILLCIINT